MSNLRTFRIEKRYEVTREYFIQADGKAHALLIAETQREPESFNTLTEHVGTDAHEESNDDDS